MLKVLCGASYEASDCNYICKETLKLSDLFENPQDLGFAEKLKPLLELEVQVLNINEGRNKEIVNRSRKLTEYSLFIAKVREFMEKEDDLLKAIRDTLKYCKEHDILKEYLEKHEVEVMNMLYYEYDRELEKEVIQEEAMEKGITQEKLTIARNALAEGCTPEFVQKITGLSLDEIAKL